MRAWVLVLLVANLAFFVWTQGWVSPWLPAPWQGQREPQRMLGQVNPERVAVRRADAASAASAASATSAAAAASTAAAASGAASSLRSAAPASGPAGSVR